MTSEESKEITGYNEGEEADLLSKDTSGWGAWTNWSQCSQSCGGGVRMRTRKCITDSCVKDADGREDYWEEPCNQDACPVTGNLTSNPSSYDKWEVIKACKRVPVMVADQETQIQNTEYRCAKLLAKQSASGMLTKYELCNPFTEENTCGTWTAWTDDSPCVRNGDKLTKVQTRECINGSCPTEEGSNKSYAMRYKQTKNVDCPGKSFLGFSLFTWFLIFVMIILIAIIYQMKSQKKMMYTGIHNTQNTQK